MKMGVVKKIFFIFIIFCIVLFGNTFVIKGFITNANDNILSDKKVDISQDSEWWKTYGGINSDNSYCFQQTSDGGYIILGIVVYSPETDWDILLIKTDKFGNEEWRNNYHRDYFDYGFFVRESDDGGYIIVGSSQASSGTRYLWLIKTDSNGEMEWDKTIAGRGFCRGNSISKTSDGGYIITGYNSYGNLGFKYDTWLIKTDSSGNFLWNKTFERSAWDEGMSVLQTSDGGYIVLGGRIESNDADYSDPFLIKTNSEGEKEWERALGDHCFWDTGRFIQFTSDGGYIVASDFLLIKTDSQGIEQWNKPIGGRCVRQTIDGGYIVVGTKEMWGAVDGFDDLVVTKTNSRGDTEWVRTFGAVGNDRGTFVFQTADEGFIISGSTEFFGSGSSDIWLIKIDKEPSLEIKDVKGGFKISASVENNGLNDIDELDWSINLDGKLFPYDSIFKGKITQGVISSLTSGEKTSIKSNTVFGIGPAIIQIRTGIVTKTARCFLLGPIILITSSNNVNSIEKSLLNI